MKFTIALDIGLSVLLQAALPQLLTDRETKTHRPGRAKRSYGLESPEAENFGHRSGSIRRGSCPGGSTAVGSLAVPHDAVKVAGVR